MCSTVSDGIESARLDSFLGVYPPVSVSPLSPASVHAVCCRLWRHWVQRAVQRAAAVRCSYLMDGSESCCTRRHTLLWTAELNPIQLSEPCIGPSSDIDRVTKTEWWRLTLEGVDCSGVGGRQSAKAKNCLFLCISSPIIPHRFSICGLCWNYVLHSLSIL